MNRDLAGAVNALTTRWLAQAGAAAKVVSGIGVWPLLALIAEPADGEGRAELSAALGIGADGAMDAAREVIAAVDGSLAVQLAAGVWTRRNLKLLEAWTARLPEGTRGEITGVAQADAQILDAWASERTGGRIDRFPLRTNADTRLVLATALLVETRWLRPFTEHPTTLGSGPWADRGIVSYLTRRGPNLDEIRVVESVCGPLTDATVTGHGGIDVHLVLAPEHVAPEQVLAAGAEAVTRDGGVRGDAFTEDNLGPGLSMQRARAYLQQDEFHLATVGFALEATHDLLRSAEVFGLRAVSEDNGDNHFPGIADEQLYVAAASQSVMAKFSALGFEAAAVTAMSMAVRGARPSPMCDVRLVTASFTRPFAFYAVDRATGLILVAGWVAEPTTREPGADGSPF